MNITVNSQHLAVELRLINKVVPSKPAIAILGHVLLEADDKLRLVGTNMEVTLSSEVAAQVNAPGQLALPADHFLKLVEQFPDADVTIAQQGQFVSVRCGNFKTQLRTLAADDFPMQPVVEGTSSTLNAAAFQRLIEKTRYAINASNAKTVLQGALLTLSGPGAAMAATDGSRLALATMASNGADASFLIQAKTLDLLAGQTLGQAAGSHNGFMDEGATKGEIELTLGEKHLFFKGGPRVLTSRMLAGKFPAYQRIIPQENDKQVTLNRFAFAAALKRVRLASPELNAVYFNLTPGQLTLAASSAEVGQADESVQIAYEGAPLKVCVNGEYVIDFLEAASGQDIVMALKDAKTPMLLTDGADYLGVVMLMKA